MKNQMNGLLAAGAVFALASTNALALDPGLKCESIKLSTSAKYARCRLTAESKAVKKAKAVDYSKCNLDKYTTAEDAGGLDCPTTSDQATVSDYLDACTTRAALWLAGGGGLPDTCASDLATCEAATCGNDAAEYGEACDGAALQGATCATEAPSTPYGTLACNGSCDGFDTSSCKPHFTDNGDGTVTDNSTGLMWEQKTTTVGSGTNYADPHDVDNHYTWTGSTAGFASGTAFSNFLGGLNNLYFAGYNDWRLPLLEELQGIVDVSAPGCGSGSPCIDAVFGPTPSGGGTYTVMYWTYSAPPPNLGGASKAYTVPFDTTHPLYPLFAVSKYDSHVVRAVRDARRD